MWILFMARWIRFRVWIPNMLSTVRIFSPMYLPYLYGETAFWFFAVIAAGVAATDLLDGYLARRWDCKSPGGALLDIMGDKAICFALIYPVMKVSNFEWFIVAPLVAMLLYDFLVLTKAPEFVRSLLEGTPLPTYMSAKIKTCLEVIALNAALWPGWGVWHVELLDECIKWFTVTSFFVCTFLAAYSVMQFNVHRSRKALGLRQTV